MNKNRYLLCILLGGVLLYYGVPRLSPLADGMEGLFSISWLVFALLVMAGNLTALLYTPKKQKQATSKSTNKVQRRKRIQYYQ
ncbi:hypothetical protein [Bacillus sp. B1-b2]|uniref:hypothetical protein n=1 Tax=Bacillus sp. B1-b2 TaxID=2653201 RepID=UPI001261466B|nr:hypothetical protein [Bacillus sp. B1-b2]KAB7667998.1 hypothetical protein F9279_13775 [Bacillus sp. B1-b2]